MEVAGAGKAPFHSPALPFQINIALGRYGSHKVNPGDPCHQERGNYQMVATMRQRQEGPLFPLLYKLPTGPCTEGQGQMTLTRGLYLYHCRGSYV